MNEYNMTKEQKMNLYILASMMGKVGRYVAFEQLQKYTLEEQYTLILKIQNIIKQEEREFLKQK